MLRCDRISSSEGRVFENREVLQEIRSGVSGCAGRRFTMVRSLKHSKEISAARCPKVKDYNILLVLYIARINRIKSICRSVYKSVTSGFNFALTSRFREVLGVLGFPSHSAAVSSSRS